VSSSIVDRLRAGTVLGAEGYVFELERRGYIKAGPFVPEVVLDFPDAVRELHREFLRAGADVMVALTYYAHREKLRDVGREGDLEAMNRQAVRIAREVAREGDALVAGNVCNTWAYDPDNPATKQTVRAMYAEQLGWAAEEGIDFVISETNDYLGEALIALEVIRGLGLPAMVTLAPTQPDQTRDGYGYADACRILAAEGAQVVGLNCDRGPQTMLPLITDRRGRPDDGDPAVTGRGAGLPRRARPLRLHALRDGALRAAGPRSRRGLRGHLLRRRPAPRPGYGRGAGPRGSGQQVLAVDGPAPHVPGRRRGQGRGLLAQLDRVTVPARKDHLVRTGQVSAAGSA
jgi:methionine synthase I (cobalamin-dependent)